MMVGPAMPATAPNSMPSQFYGINYYPLKAAGAGATRKSNLAKASAKLDKLVDELWS